MCSIVWVMLGSGPHPGVSAVTARTNPLVPQRRSRRYWMPPTPRLPPATDAAIPKTRAGVIPMTIETRFRKISFSKTFKEDIGGRYPRWCSCREIGRERDFGRLFSTQQRPNVFRSDAWLAPATYHGRVVNAVTRVWVRALHRRTR